MTLINLCSLAGIVVLPLMNKSFYSTLLMFLIALAVGSLSANGILCLIPEVSERAISIQANSGQLLAGSEYS